MNLIESIGETMQMANEDVQSQHVVTVNRSKVMLGTNDCKGGAAAGSRNLFWGRNGRIVARGHEQADDADERERSNHVRLLNFLDDVWESRRHTFRGGTPPPADRARKQRAKRIVRNSED